MCGIAGIVHFGDQRPVGAAALKAMAGRMHHRGPDDQGFVLDHTSGTGLTMCRLAIVDLAGGQQPMQNEDGTVHVVFNGEIYNHMEVRGPLLQSGHRFRSQADTEVIVHAYEVHGAACPELFNGMFALAVWDRRHRRLLLARDRMGIKPLYYWLGRDTLVFASEIGALVASGELPVEIDLQSLDRFLTWEYIPAPDSILKGVRKLPPGHVLVLEDGGVEIKPYWELEPEAVLPDDPAADGQRASHLRELLKDAVRCRLMADVPLGAFLSGGVDSTGLVGLMSGLMDRPVRSFSIGFDDPSYNELPWARKAAVRHGCDHHEEILRPQAQAWTTEAMAFLDEPLGDFSCLPTYLVSRCARQEVKVALSGDGGDELFAGYDSYRAQQLAPMYQRLPRRLRQSLIEPFMARLPPSPAKKGLLNKAKRFVEGAALPGDLGHARWMLFMGPAEKETLYTAELGAAVGGADPYRHVRRALARAAGSHPLSQALFADLTTYLVDNILVKVDRMSMAASLEARVPYLDHRVVEYAVSLPARLKFQAGRSKVILKAALADLIPPEIQNRPKEGFSIPVKNWLKTDLREMMEDHLSSRRLVQRGFFRPAAVRTLMDQHLSGGANHSHKLWALMVLENWCQRILDPSIPAADETAG